MSFFGPRNVFIAMLVSAFVLIPLGIYSDNRASGPLWDHWFLALEAIQLALFTVFWIWQERELWAQQKDQVERIEKIQAEIES